MKRTAESRFKKMRIWKEHSFSGDFTVKVRRRIGGMNSGMPSAPARLLWVVVRPHCGRMEV